MRRSRIDRLAILPLVALATWMPAAVAQDKEAKPERPVVYDESADAAQDIQAALAAAKKENRRVLIQWGANWCGWCVKLHELCATDRTIKRKLLYEYDVVTVDVGRFDKNLELAAKYGAEIGKGIPLLTFLDADGRVIANVETGPLEEGGGHVPERVMAVLEEHQAPYLPAESILTEGLARARREKKVAFLHFGAPWCGWCHRLEDWMALEDVHKVLETGIVDIKIDIDRTIGGKDVLAKFQGDLPGGIPWFALLAPDGTVIANGIVDGKNLGCPWTVDEKAKFARLLEEHTAIPPTAIAEILKSLGEGTDTER